jgi:hypothetical protein
MMLPLILDVENLDNSVFVNQVIMSIIVFMKIYKQLVSINVKDKINYLESVIIMFVSNKEPR